MTKRRNRGRSAQKASGRTEVDQSNLNISEPPIQEVTIMNDNAAVPETILLTQSDILNLHLKEYEALRAEQRTRLDAANKLINYNVLILGAVISGLAVSYKTALNEFIQVLCNVLLAYPVLSMPLTFTQWNDEIIVDRIGRYLDEIMKADILQGKEFKEAQFWGWEKYHNTDKPSVMWISGAARSSLFITIALGSIVLLIIKCDIATMEIYKKCLLSFDCILVLIGLWVGYRLARRKTYSIPPFTSIFGYKRTRSE